MTAFNASTLGAKLDAGFDLWAQCYREGCRHHAQVDLAMLAARLGRDHSTLRKDLCPHLRCRKCDGKDVGIWTSGGGKGMGLASSTEFREKRAMSKPYEIVRRPITKIDDVWASVPANPPKDLRTWSGFAAFIPGD